jgi:RNA polymerase sigma factor (sigma-70 family)
MWGVVASGVGCLAVEVGGCGDAEVGLRLVGEPGKFSRGLAEVLRNADRTIRYLAPGEHRRLYNVWRVTMGSIAPVDSFYVAFFRDERFLVVPYAFDEPDEYEPPGFQMYGPAGLSAWIKMHAKPYLYSTDHGRLLNMGHSFGDDERLSRDAIAIPLLGPPSDGPAVIGIASMQTYKSDAYDEQVARAFQWLGRSVLTALAREREDVEYREMLDPDSGRRTDPVSVAETVEHFGHTLEVLRSRINDLIVGEPSDREGLIRELEALRMLCETTQSEMVDLLMKPSREAREVLAELTPREREVAELIGEGLTNEQIAARLAISEPTVKTHVTRILKRFGVRQRAAVVAKLRPFE